MVIGRSIFGVGEEEVSGRGRIGGIVGNRQGVVNAPRNDDELGRSVGVQSSNLT